MGIIKLENRVVNYQEFIDEMYHRHHHKGTVGENMQYILINNYYRSSLLEILYTVILKIFVVRY